MNHECRRWPRVRQRTVVVQILNWEDDFLARPETAHLIAGSDNEIVEQIYDCYPPARFRIHVRFLGEFKPECCCGR